jgi:hypothetical protein
MQSAEWYICNQHHSSGLTLALLCFFHYIFCYEGRVLVTLSCNLRCTVQSYLKFLNYLISYSFQKIMIFRNPFEFVTSLILTESPSKPDSFYMRQKYIFLQLTLKIRWRRLNSAAHHILQLFVSPMCVEIIGKMFLTCCLFDLRIYFFESIYVRRQVHSKSIKKSTTSL